MALGGRAGARLTGKLGLRSEPVDADTAERRGPAAPNGCMKNCGSGGHQSSLRTLRRLTSQLRADIAAAMPPPPPAAMKVASWMSKGTGTGLDGSPRRSQVWPSLSRDRSVSVSRRIRATVNTPGLNPRPETRQPARQRDPSTPMKKSGLADLHTAEARPDRLGGPPPIL